MRSKYDKVFKSEVIDKGLVKDFFQLKKQFEKDAPKVADFENGIIYRLNYWSTYEAIQRFENSQFDCAYLLARSKIRKAQKVREKISDLVMNKEAVFLTLTFRDDIFDKTTPQTRRRYVSRFLKGVSGQYVANIDFSPDVGREHYHAVITQRVNLKDWSFGFAYAEKIRCHKSDLTRVSKYITKLTAHALKVDATRLIYSRL